MQYITSKLQMLELKASLVPDMSVSCPMFTILSSESLVLDLRMSLTASWFSWTIDLISWSPTKGWYPSPIAIQSAIPEQRCAVVRRASQCCRGTEW